MSKIFNFLDENSRSRSQTIRMRMTRIRYYLPLGYDIILWLFLQHSYINLVRYKHYLTKGIQWLAHDHKYIQKKK